MQRSPFNPFSLGLLFLGCGSLILALGIFRGDSGFDNYFDLSESKEILEKTVTALEDSNKALENEINLLHKSPSYARKVLRDKYHVTDPNEDIVFFAD